MVTRGVVRDGRATARDRPHRRSLKQIFQGDHLDRQAACRRWSRLRAGAAALSPSLRSRVNSAKGKGLTRRAQRSFAALRMT